MSLSFSHFSIITITNTFISVQKQQTTLYNTIATTSKLLTYTTITMTDNHSSRRPSSVKSTTSIRGLISRLTHNVSKLSPFTLPLTQFIALTINSLKSTLFTLRSRLRAASTPSLARAVKHRSPRPKSTRASTKRSAFQSKFTLCVLFSISALAFICDTTENTIMTISPVGHE